VTVTEQMTEAQERVLRGVEAAQDQMIDMNRRVAEAMTNILPDGDRFGSQSLPGVANMPKPNELIDRYFDFTAKMADANRSFYKEMVAVWAPSEQKPAAKSTAGKSTAGKSTASKSTASKSTASKSTASNKAKKAKKSA